MSSEHLPNMDYDSLSLKEKKIEFVSNLNGTTILEVNLISTVSTTCYLLRAFLIALLPSVLMQNVFARFLLDLAVLFIPLILSVTLCSEYIWELFYAALALCVTLYFFVSQKNSGSKSKEEEHSPTVAKTLLKNVEYKFAFDELSQEDSGIQEEDSSSSCKTDKSQHDFLFLLTSNLPFVTTFRSFVNIATCICILAVDFHVFPRRFAKVETYGVSVMDLGVGGFIVANALVSPEARNSQSRDKPWSLQRALSTVFLQILSTWPIIALGIGRLVVVSSAVTQQHVSEYGVHWNFFFTLAAVRVFSSILLTIMNPKFCGILAFIIAGLYQFYLSDEEAGWTEFLLSDDHEGNLLVQNKEGISSSIGILALYLAGIELGSFLFKPRQTYGQWKQAANHLFLINGVCWFALYASISYVQPVSRRMGNMSYLLWLLSYSTLILFQYLAVDLFLVGLIYSGTLPIESMPNRWITVTKQSVNKQSNVGHTPNAPSLCLIKAINRNQLSYFLLCNILTGLVNMSIDTMSVNDLHAFLTLCVYSFIGAIVMWYLHFNSISLKFW